MHPAVLTELKKRWKNVGANHESCYVAEYSEADWEAGRISGDPAKAWVFNGTDYEEVDPSSTPHNRKPKAGGVFVQAGLRYAFNPEDQQMMLVEFVTGVLSGSGQLMKISGDGEALLQIPEGTKWSTG